MALVHDMIAKQSLASGLTRWRRLGDQDRLRATQLGHLIEHPAANADFGRLGVQTPGVQVIANKVFSRNIAVSTNER